ncbi:hypothetical protein N0K71_07420 [Dellaglioa algida]|uniref:Uncharacterized protein n=1 Tax=Dellaglioa algida DSM 15638 TaxID=1423719 RepID=A0A0R1HI46_9LACO|nr:hypothetical protein [Dellaglioa algida]KRK45129.1 hypothetical protein FC66_GL000487 [Dellaglioa algida DSM 15638]MDK1733450.1 hypothetical protein [Dellaglioa algida]MDK1734971.1 hypothetical protein [Dellaglioa algida]
MSKKFLLGLAITGGVAAYAASKLISEKTKQDIKNQIEEKAMDARDRVLEYKAYAEDASYDLKDKIGDFDEIKNNISDTISEKSDLLMSQDAYANAKDALINAKNDLKNKLAMESDDIFEQMTDLTDEFSDLADEDIYVDSKSAFGEAKDADEAEGKAETIYPDGWTGEK